MKLYYILYFEHRKYILLYFEHEIILYIIF